MGAWKVIIPELRDNYVKNPVAMSAFAGTITVSGAGASVAISTTYSYLGYRSCLLTGGGAAASSAIYVTQELPDYDHYVTCRVHTSSTFTGNLTVTTDSGANYFTMTLLGQEGDWKVYGRAVLAMYCNTSVATAIVQSSFNTTVIIGHIQVEVGAYPTTPITGDIKGFTPDGYKWFGEPHKSLSRRYWFERSGGYEVDLEDTYNFRVMYGNGIGMPPIQHHIQGMALLPGALYQGHKVLPRVLDLVSATKANTTATVAHARSHFINAIKPDAVVPEQPVVFRYYGNSIKPVEFHAYYDSGMEFQTSSGIVDKPTVRFICYDPFAYETHTESMLLERYDTITSADYIVRKVAGKWYNVSTHFDARVMALTKGIDGCIYIGGDFTDAGGGWTGHNIVKWNPFTPALVSLTGGTGSGCNDDVIELVTAANGDIYIGGLFTAAGGIANTRAIAYWDVSASEFVTVGNGFVDAGDEVWALAVGDSGEIYIGGFFTDHFDGNGDYITKWDGAAFSSLGSGMDDMVYGMAVAPNGDLYVTGKFHLAGGVANTVHVAYWDVSASVWLPLGTGLNGTGQSIAIDAAGNVYVGGTFTTANGVACNNIAKWNGKTFEPLGAGVSGGGINKIAIDPEQLGLIYIGGEFTSAGGVTINDRVAIWNGTGWNGVDIDLPGSPIVHNLLLEGDDIYIGYDTAGSATASYTNNVVVSNSGSHMTYPIFKIYRAEDGTSATLKWIRNETTRQTIYCNYKLQKHETLTIDFTPGNRSVTSSFYGDVWRAVLRGSDLAEFGLIGGTNVITVYCKEVGNPTVQSWMNWKITHWAADTAAA